MLQLLSKAFYTAARWLRSLARRLYSTPQDKRVRLWRRDGAERTLRYDYDLSQDSVVFDLGGFEGQWTSDIFAMYACRCLVFEPVKSFADKIKERFRKNGKVEVYDFGLAAQDGQARISLDKDRSSLVATGKHVQVADLVCASKFIKDRGVDAIDLMKINIEGAEYDLLEHLLDEGLVEHIRDIQVQFHDFEADSSERMHTIQARLARTHRLTYQYPFVWENWRRKGA